MTHLTRSPRDDVRHRNRWGTGQVNTSIEGLYDPFFNRSLDCAHCETVGYVIRSEIPRILLIPSSD